MRPLLTHHCDLILGRVANQPFLVIEGDVRWSRPVALVVGDYLNPVTPKDGNARVRRTQIDSNSGHGCSSSSVVVLGCACWRVLIRVMLLVSV